MNAKSDGASVLKLSAPAGKAPQGNAAMGVPTPEDKIAEQARLAELQDRIRELEVGNAALEEEIKKKEQQQSESTTKKAGSSRHVAHAEGWNAICTAPDYCRVGKDIVAFNSFATLDTKVSASPNVKARGTAVYRKGDVIQRVKGDAGKHIVSGTSLGSGHVKILEGHDNVKVNGIPAARHDSRCLINCDASGVGGAQGKLVTEQKSVQSKGGGAASNAAVPPGSRTSPKLDALKSARKKVASGMLDLDAIDELVNFKESNQVIDALIGEIRGVPGTLGDQAAQVGRGALGFVKDAVLGIAELAYEGIKVVPKVIQLSQTKSGQVLTQLDAQILSENIKLGNITAGTVGKTVLELGKSIVKPVTDPWEKKQYIESITRGAAEVGSMGLGWIKARNVAKTARTTEIAKAKSAGEAPLVRDSKAPSTQDGIHIAKVQRRARPEPNGFEGPNGYKTHGINENPLRSPEGRKVFEKYKSQGFSDDEALKKAREIMESGSTMPSAIDLVPGEKLYKVTPEGVTPGKHSAYFATRQEIDALKGMSYDQIADRLGIPLESQQTLRFDVMEVTVKEETTVFQSVIARTTQNGYAQPGGGIQSIITDRKAFSDPVLIGLKLP